MVASGKYPALSVPALGTKKALGPNVTISMMLKYPGLHTTNFAFVIASASFSSFKMSHHLNVFGDIHRFS